MNRQPVEKGPSVAQLPHATAWQAGALDRCWQPPGRPTRAQHAHACSPARPPTRFSANSPVGLSGRSLVRQLVSLTTYLTIRSSFCSPLGLFSRSLIRQLTSRPIRPLARPSAPLSAYLAVRSSTESPRSLFGCSDVRRHASDLFGLSLICRLAAQPVRRPPSTVRLLAGPLVFSFGLPSNHSPVRLPPHPLTRPFSRSGLPFVI